MFEKIEQNTLKKNRENYPKQLQKIISENSEKFQENYFKKFGKIITEKSEEILKNSEKIIESFRRKQLLGKFCRIFWKYFDL